MFNRLDTCSCKEWQQNMLDDCMMVSVYWIATAFWFWRILFALCICYWNYF